MVHEAGGVFAVANVRGSGVYGKDWHMAGFKATKPNTWKDFIACAEWLVRALEAEGVDTLFGYPGGCIMPFYDALLGSRMHHVLVRHEQAAALAANGYARHSGRVGVCVATSGPGASNLVTGIADALLDSVPMVCLTGQVPTHLMGTDAFQELDVFGMTLPIVKHSYLPRSVDELPAVLHEAFHLARSGRPGPVLIDLPKDVQLACADHLPSPAPIESPPVVNAVPVGLVEALALIARSKKPVVYGGGGIAIAGATFTLRAKAATIAGLAPAGSQLAIANAADWHDLPALLRHANSPQAPTRPIAVDILVEAGIWPSEEALAALVARAVEAGFRTLKLKAGVLPVTEEIARMLAGASVTDEARAAAARLLAAKD